MNVRCSDDRPSLRRAGRARWTAGLALLALGAGLALWKFWPAPESDEPSFEEPELSVLRITPQRPLVGAVPLGPGALRDGNVLLVTLDTTRADRLGCYGNEAIQTPTFDRLAAEGVVFSAATAVAPTTLPSHASLLTGLYPAHHGVRTNGLFRLEDTHETLAERLRAEGYRTGAVVSAFVLDSQYGLAQGFDEYDDEVEERENALQDHYAERDAEGTTTRALRWLRDVGEERFLLWVHYFDPHHDYAPPSPYAETYGANPYDGEIAYVDAQVQRLLDALDERGLTDKTLVVVVGDHGEGLAQHGERTHGYLTYDATLRVPLILRCGRRLGGGVHCPRPVSQVDVTPTVLSLLGIDPPDGMDGHDLTAEIPEDRPAYFETLTGTLEYGWEPLVGVVRGQFKYIHGSEPELFDRAVDPRERRNLAAVRPALASALEALLPRVFGDDLSRVARVSPNVRPSAEDLERLQALGYAGGGAGDGSDGEAAGSPRTMIHVLHRVQLAENPDKPAARSIEELTAVLREHPDFFPAWKTLGDVYRRENDLGGAAAALTRCLALRPDTPQAVFELALVRTAQQDRAEALRLLTPLVREYPSFVRARYLYGTLLGASGQLDAAAGHLRTVFELDPLFERCVEHMVGAFTGTGRVAELVEILHGHLAKEPGTTKVRFALAGVLERQGDVPRAAAVLRQGLDASPRDGELVSRLALLLAGSSDPSVRDVDAATSMLESFCAVADPPSPAAMFTLSQIYASAGRLEEAEALAEQALAGAAGDPTLATAIDRHLARLRAAKSGRP